MSNAIALNSQLVSGMGAASLGRARAEIADDFSLKWPFPPAPARNAPAGDEALDGRPQRAALRAGDSLAAAACRQAGPSSQFKGAGGALSRSAMVTDIFLVGMWGAMIPGLMWLGAAFGF